MMSEKSKKQGRHGERDTKMSQSLSHEALKLLKTQDAGYLRVVGESARRELEEVERDVKLQEGMEDVAAKSSKNGKVVFVESKEGQREQLVNREDDEDEEDNDDAEPQTTTQPKSKKQIEAEKKAFMDLRAARKLKKRAAEARRNKLEALQKRHEDLLAAEQELGWQRARSENSVGGVNKNGVKWKIRERKK